jgi:hypothetical protein
MYVAYYNAADEAADAATRKVAVDILLAPCPTSPRDARH